MSTEDATTDQQLPEYAGWKTSMDGRNFVAARDVPVTSYQDNWGAVDEVEAGSVQELALLVEAQTQLASALAQAEQLDTADRAERRHRYLRDAPRPTIAF